VCLRRLGWCRGYGRMHILRNVETRYNQSQNSEDRPSEQSRHRKPASGLVGEEPDKARREIWSRDHGDVFVVAVTMVDTCSTGDTQTFLVKDNAP